MAQALTEAAIVTSSVGRYDLALPFVERRLALSRVLYGTHRETGYALHDLASVLLEINDGRSDAAQALLREAIEMRTAVLGPEHPEVSGAMSALREATDGPTGSHAKPVNSNEAPEPTQPIDWVEADQVLYWFDKQGRFLASGFDRRATRVIHERPFDADADVYVSSDRRWILYGRSLRNGRTAELWLFDTRGDPPRKVLEVPSSGLGVPQFSPDGRAIAFYLSGDDLRPAKQSMGLYLVDTGTARTDHYGSVPSFALSPGAIYGSVEWSRQGDTVVINAFGNTGSVYIREAYALSFETRNLRRIEERSAIPEMEYGSVRTGTKIDVNEETQARSRVWYGHLEGSAGVVADITEQYELVVTLPGKPPILVDTGGRNDCEGITIGINGWVDGNKYLVYSISGQTYIADPRSGRKAPLFSAADAMGTFTW